MRTNALRALTVCACIGAPAFASVSVAPTSAAGGSVITSTVTFSPSAGAPLVNGSIKVLPPLSWGGGLQTVSPAQPGYVFAQYSSGGLATVVMSSTSAAATVQNVTLTSTASINVVFNGLVVSCPPAGQSGANWNVAVATSASAALALVGQPSTAYISGSANSLAFVPWNSFTVAANQPSAAFTVQPVDHCGNVVALTSSLTVTLAGLIQSAPPTNFYGTDNTAQF